MDKYKEDYVKTRQLYNVDTQGSQGEIKLWIRKLQQQS
jgi:hypothetical protein